MSSKRAFATIDEKASRALTSSLSDSSAPFASSSCQLSLLFDDINQSMPIQSSPVSKKRCIFPNSGVNMAQNHRNLSCSALPSLHDNSDQSDALLMGESSTTGELDLTVSPANFINTILQQSNGHISKLCGDDNIFAVASRAIVRDSYFISLTEQQQLAYNTAKVGAVQNNDVDSLRMMLHSGELMQTSNKWGESLLHTACRRGFTNMVHFFLYEAGVCPRIRDDMGRTPMHDACWSSCAPNHDLLKMLIESAPEMLLSRDKRGHTPFDYARREHWPNWVMFLNENRQFIVRSFLHCLDGESVSTNSLSVSGDSTN